MCVAVYITSPSPLPLVAWHEETPAFYVQEAEAADPVRARFAWPNVYYAGSHEGCVLGGEAFDFEQLRMMEFPRSQ